MRSQISLVARKNSMGSVPVAGRPRRFFVSTWVFILRLTVIDLLRLTHIMDIEIETQANGGLEVLTESKCRAAVPGKRPDGSPKTVLLHDGSGLYLQCNAGAGDSVNKSWLYRDSVAGKGRQIGLGAYPTVSLAEARKAADVQRGIRAAGKDPLLERRAARAELETQLATDLRKPRSVRRSAKAPRRTSPRTRPSGAAPSLRLRGRQRLRRTPRR
jgi:hypothetical protein